MRIVDVKQFTDEIASGSPKPTMLYYNANGTVSVFDESEADIFEEMRGELRKLVDGKRINLTQEVVDTIRSQKDRAVSNAHEKEESENWKEALLEQLSSKTVNINVIKSVLREIINRL